MYVGNTPSFRGEISADRGKITKGNEKKRGKFERKRKKRKGKWKIKVKKPAK